jgi:hypothetical protein
MERSFIIVSVLTASTLLACGRNKKACDDAKKNAETAVTHAYETAIIDRDSTQIEAERARARPLKLANRQTSLETDLKLFEMSMGCLEKADCCAHITTLSSTGLTFVPPTLLASEPDGAIPPEVLPAIQPLIALRDQDTFLDAKDAATWCTHVREAIAHARKEAPAGWKQAIEAANREATEAAARATAQEKRITSLQQWAGALQKGAKVEVSADIANSSPEAVKAVRAYEAACH